MEYEISKYKPCISALEYRAKFEKFEEAWESCENPEWMLWLAIKLKVDVRILTLVKGRIAEMAINLMTDQRSKEAVRAAIAFGEGKIDIKQLTTAYISATDAADAADAAYTAAAYAASTADAAATDAAAYAAYTADAAATDAAAYAAYTAACIGGILAFKKNSVNICRSLLSQDVFKKLEIV